MIHNNHLSTKLCQVTATHSLKAGRVLKDLNGLLECLTFVKNAENDQMQVFHIFHYCT